ncbi:MAG: hypothetical protein J7J10_03055 [Deltaproteobacteria bacterium]|nr:hypothetical protein [Deltaproteobacteria bacterium]
MINEYELKSKTGKVLGNIMWKKSFWDLSKLPQDLADRLSDLDVYTIIPREGSNDMKISVTTRDELWASCAADILKKEESDIVLEPLEGE